MNRCVCVCVCVCVAVVAGGTVLAAVVMGAAVLPGDDV